MIRRAFLGLVFGLAASCAQAQTAPSPADVGISKGTSDVFKLKGGDNAWTPFGSIDRSTHIFIPGTNGPIAPNDCVKWGPGLTSAGAACNSVTGGAHPANQLTIYTSHSGLVNNVTTPTEAWTVAQQGFYSPGDGGDAVYQWSLTSYCAGGTSSAPKAADGLACVLPIGQDPSIAGRYLLSIEGSLDVRKVGMQPGGFDNYPIIQTLMSAISPGAFVESTMEVVIPATLGQQVTEYYFSQPFVLSRNMNLACKGANNAGQLAVRLVFPPGIDGIIQESGYYTVDGQWGQSTIRGCEIMSLGAGGAKTPSPTGGSNVLNNVVLNNRVGIPLPASCNPNFGTCTFGVGDGIIAMGVWIPVGLAVDQGAYVATSDGLYNGTITLAAPYTVKPLTDGNDNMEVWDLPASQKYTIQTTEGSPTAIVTAGPRPLRHGDMIWTEAFLFGASVENQDSNNSFPQTIDLWNVTMTSPAPALAGKTGTYQMWTVPEGIKRRVGGSSYETAVWYFGMGLDLICQGGNPATGCDNTMDQHNTYWFNLVGRLTRGDNTTNGTVIGDVGAHNTISDVVEAGTLGSTYISEEANSQDGGSSSYGVLVFCDAQNYSVFIGTYLSGQVYGPCLGYDAQGNPSINVAAGSGGGSGVPSQLFIGSTYGYGAISSQTFAGLWRFYGSDGITGTATVASAAGQNVLGGVSGTRQSMYRGMVITDTTNPVIPDGTTITDFTTSGIVLSNNLTGTVQIGDQIPISNNPSITRGGPCVSMTPGHNTNTGSGMSFDLRCSSGGLNIGFDGLNGAWDVGSIIMPNYGYIGAPIQNDEPIFGDGVRLGNNSEDYLGMERSLDTGASTLTELAWHQQGDTRLNSKPVPSGNMAWTNAEVARTTLSANVVSGTTTSVAVAACPDPAFVGAGTPVHYVPGGPDVHNIQLNAEIGTLNDCTGTTLTLQAASLIDVPSGQTIQFLAWRQAAHIANDYGGTSWPVAAVVNIVDLAPCNSGTLGMGVVFNGQTVAAAGYGAPVGPTGSSIRPVFCDATSWTYH